MKKILLSSIIMLGVCGAVNAQDATGSKVKKNNQATISTAAASAAPTPQKSAIAVQSEDVTTAAAPRTAADKEAAAAAPTRIKTKTVQDKAPASVSVNAEGVVMTDEQKDIAYKLEQEKAAKEKKNKQ